MRVRGDRGPAAEKTLTRTQTGDPGPGILKLGLLAGPANLGRPGEATGEARAQTLREIIDDHPRSRPVETALCAAPVWAASLPPSRAANGDVIVGYLNYSRKGNDESQITIKTMVAGR